MDKRIVIRVDDTDRHGEGCRCGYCNSIGKSYGASAYLLGQYDDPLIREYAASYHGARSLVEFWASIQGYTIVEEEE